MYQGRPVEGVLRCLGLDFAQPSRRICFVAPELGSTLGDQREGIDVEPPAQNISVSVSSSHLRNWCQKLVEFGPRSCRAHVSLIQLYSISNVSFYFVFSTYFDGYAVGFAYFATDVFCWRQIPICFCKGNKTFVV